MSDLIEYIENPERKLLVKNKYLNELVNLRPGEKVLIEVEKLGQSDDTCLSASITMKDPTGKQVFTDQLFKLNRVDNYSHKNKGGGSKNP